MISCSTRVLKKLPYDQHVLVAPEVRTEVRGARRKVLGNWVVCLEARGGVAHLKKSIVAAADV